MKEQHLYILGGVFIALLIIFIIVDFATKPKSAVENVEDLIQTVIFGVSNEDISEIEIYKQTADKEIKMNFIKQEDKWYIPTYHNAKAKEYSMNRIINDLLEMTGKVRSTDPKHLTTFKITDEQGIHIILKDEAQKPLANLIVGKKGEDYNTGFVRYSGKEKVYSVDKNLLSALSIYGEADTLSKFKQKPFVELNAVKMEKKELQLAVLGANGKEMIIKKVEKEVEEEKKEESEEAQADTTKPKKKEYEWVLARNTKEVKLDQKEVDKFLNVITSIYAQDVVDHIGNTLADLEKHNKYRLGRPSHYIVLMKDNDEMRYQILFGKEYEKDKGYYMFVQYDNLVYKVNKSKFDSIFKWVDELPKKKPTES